MHHKFLIDKWGISKILLIKNSLLKYYTKYSIKKASISEFNSEMKPKVKF
ncbi:MAG: hypothetical protein HLUCCX10_06320 [Algoriphagus marincola HL-49]|uniref:Uncharacterized protein n=1 Tax=Algoriphagus marincola HL-49 TaxID=1305737 RepID=A0A0P7XLF2_9BACT|nr:MAG: hypothetical protein HLUCCX10_06320 [Algoriphagus marincola HL-49]